MYLTFTARFVILTFVIIWSDLNLIWLPHCTVNALCSVSGCSCLSSCLHAVNALCVWGPPVYKVKITLHKINKKGVLIHKSDKSCEINHSWQKCVTLKLTLSLENVSVLELFLIFWPNIRTRCGLTEASRCTLSWAGQKLISKVTNELCSTFRPI